MITLSFKISYTREQYAAQALTTFIRDQLSIKRMIDHALNLRAKLIFDSQAFQSVALETSVKSIKRVGANVFFVIQTNQKRLVSNYEAGLNGTTFFLFDGVSLILKNQFQRDELLNGDYILSVFATAENYEKVVTPTEQALTPIAEPIANVFEAIKTPLIVLTVCAAAVAIVYYTYKILELKK